MGEDGGKEYSRGDFGETFGGRRGVGRHGVVCAEGEEVKECREKSPKGTIQEGFLAARPRLGITDFRFTRFNGDGRECADDTELD